MAYTTEPNVNGCRMHREPCTYDSTLSGRARHVHSTYKGFTIAMHVDHIAGADWYDVYDPVTKHYQASVPTLRHARALANDLIRFWASK